MLPNLGRKHISVEWQISNNGTFFFLQLLYSQDSPTVHAITITIIQLRQTTAWREIYEILVILQSKLSQILPLQAWLH